MSNDIIKLLLNVNNIDCKLKKLLMIDMDYVI